MFFDDFVLSDRHARLRQQEILREVEQIRLAKQIAPQPRRVIQHLIAALMVMLQR